MRRKNLLPAHDCLTARCPLRRSLFLLSQALCARCAKAAIRACRSSPFTASKQAYDRVKAAF